MIADDASAFLLPPPAPPERRWRIRVILAASAALHLGLLALFLSMGPAETASGKPQATRETVRVLQGEVVTSDSPDPNAANEPGLRLIGYREGPIGVSLESQRAP